MRNAKSAPALPPDVVAWLQAQGAASVRVGDDGIIEFSRRPLAEALTAAARALLPTSNVALTPQSVTSGEEAVACC